MEPGMHKLMINEVDGTTATGIGEADELRRRVAHYKSPGPTQPTKQANQRRC